MADVAPENVEAVALFNEVVACEDTYPIDRPRLESDFDGIDAAFFTGDAFHDGSNRKRALFYIQRWCRELARLEASPEEELNDILKWVESLEDESISDDIEELKGKSVTVIEDSSSHSSELTQSLYVTGIYGTSYSFTRKGLKVVEYDRWVDSIWYDWTRD